ncbi:hypothetical protein ABEB36_014130 [Hypothenemus hampei]|uniref:HECT domain-containing protein n=1 Tax=Hypothenemus hampei TaxID=57062 RepID=A0ABD1E5I0_HYPHA
MNEFKFDLFDYQKNQIDEDTTVDSLLECIGLTKLRFYLASKKIPATDTGNSQIEIVDLSECSSNDVYPTEGSCCSTAINEHPIMNSVASSYEYVSETSHDINDDDTHKSSKETIKGSQTLQQLSTDYNVLVNSILDEICVNSNTVFNTSNASDYSISWNLSSTEEKAAPVFTSFHDITKSLQDQIDETKVNKFNIYRDDIFACCIRALRRKSFAPFNRISVKFSDIEGMSEGAVDEGGPKREMFRLVLSTIKNSNLFVGNKKKHISLNEAGRLIALSLVHGGPAPHFFSELLFNLVVGNDVEGMQFGIEDVTEEIRDSLINLQNAKNLTEARDIIISNNIFSIAGYTFISNEEDKIKIIQGTLRFYVVSRIKEALDQFVEGLKTCGVYNYLKEYPHLFRSEMCDNPKSITSDDFEQLFSINYSEQGSNHRQKENKIISFFRDYLVDCERKILVFIFLFFILFLRVVAIYLIPVFFVIFSE